MWAPCKNWKFYVHPFYGGTLGKGVVAFACEYTPIGYIAWMCVKNRQTDGYIVIDDTQNNERGYCHGHSNIRLLGLGDYYKINHPNCLKCTFIDDNILKIRGLFEKFSTYCEKSGARRAAYAFLGLAQFLPFPKDIFKLIAGLVIDSWRDPDWEDARNAWVQDYVTHHWTPHQLNWPGIV